jgi:hypothetical protein
LVLVVLVGGCAYKPGSFTGDGRAFPGKRMTVGCLDLSVARRRDAENVAVLEYDFANRCDHAATVDLKDATVTGVSRGARHFALEPYDPQHELASLQLDALTVGGEVIAYQTGEIRFPEICVDVASIAHVEPRRVTCLDVPLATPNAPLSAEPVPQATDTEAPPAPPITGSDPKPE